MKQGKFALRSLMCLYFSLWLGFELCSQPYVDPFQVRYTYAFRKNNSAATPFTHLWMGSDLPIKLKENTYLLFSPFYEQWRIDSAKKEEFYPTVHSLALPLGLIIPLHQNKWSLTFIPTFRWNGEKMFDDNTFQFGAATFASFVRKPLQKFRFGVYANKEFFGLFVMPLLGADWRLDEKNYIFGLLPGRLTWEHMWSRKLYGGATFRAITNSYRLSSGQFLRLQDNQVSLFLDYYPAKPVVLTLEPGYGLFRKVRTGINDRNYITKSDWGDGPFIKLNASYRIRL